MKKVLGADFFNRSTIEVAEKLLGKFLVRRRRAKIEAYIITEVEAYDGPRDRASHASRGLTSRNKIMFGPAGYWYVYFTYGMHWMLNVVTGPKDYPAAVLIRGVESPSGQQINGPARITKALKINRAFNNESIAVKTGLWVEDRGVRIGKKSIKRTARVGVTFAGRYWARRKYRFALIHNIIKSADRVKGVK